MTIETPDNLLEAVRYFSDLKICNEYMRGIKWPNGQPVCHKCGSVNVAELSTRPVLKCRDCKKQFSYKVGTIFEDSPLGLDKWFVAVWAVANVKNGISSHELGRALGVTQKSAWFMLHRIREAMRTGTFRKLSGTVETPATRPNTVENLWASSPRRALNLNSSASPPIKVSSLSWRQLCGVDGAGFMGLQ